MTDITCYKVKIKHYNNIFNDTVTLYRGAADFFIGFCLQDWDVLKELGTSYNQLRYVELHTHMTKNHPEPKCNFDVQFYKFPSYLRRSAINTAIGKVSSYMSNLANYKSGKDNRKPSIPQAGYCFPAMYKDDSYKRPEQYSAEIKVFTQNTWKWLTVKLKKTDVDYITKRCTSRKECAPVLRK